jgi:metal-sulfur cluster biosynthetic enzyme
MDEYKDEINLGDNVVKKLKSIYDPEIPVDIYELGLIYDVMINEDNEVKILMTLTSQTSPFPKSLPIIIKNEN